ncbi:MAG: phosphoenolpyruvate carboxylase [Planctomycetota bacterium]
MADTEPLRREIAHLGRLFGDVLHRFAGGDAFNLVEEVRGLARQFRDGDDAAGDRLAALLKDLGGDDLLVVIKAFTGFLELANLAEDRQRVRALRSRELEHAPEPRRESIRAGLQELAARGLSAEQLAEAVAAVDIELVFTAHPTEAKRKSLRSKLRAIRGLLSTVDEEGLLPAEKALAEQRLRGEIVKMWQTDLVRPHPPTVMEEVRRGLSIQPVLWRTVPRVLRELRDAIDEYFPGAGVAAPRVLRFGSWMGGDRDGHPYVLPETTEETIMWLRRSALSAHAEACQRLFESLSLATERAGSGGAMLDAVDRAVGEWPETAAMLERLAPHEGYRRWLKIIEWRLAQTAATGLDDAPLPGDYGSFCQLRGDVQLLADTLAATGNADLVAAEVQPWLDQVAAFGLCTARLDVRQHSGVYRAVMDEIWLATQFTKAGDPPLDEAARQAMLLRTMPIAANLSPVDLSEDARKTLDLFRVLRRVARRFGMEVLGCHVISMTAAPSDLLTVLWLWKWSERTGGVSSVGRDEHDATAHLPVAPLFETIGDLTAATDILTTTLDIPVYREHVAELGDRQIVMIGYSDSTKDGGYLAAAWSLQGAQIELSKAAAERGVDLTFFHGRGGSLGRGGGPAARAIQSLPTEAFDGSLRLTEQGEVLAERYDDPRIAHRHLEQVVWSVLTTRAAQPGELNPDWAAAIQQMSELALAGYRELVDHAGFVPFFRTATPIAGIEGLRIGSRPAKRKKGDRIEDLRAIPWVFSWTQCRALLPAWYGVGAAVERFRAQADNATDLLADMYENWPFFRATIDNSTLAMAKSNMRVFRRYATQAIDQSDDPAAATEIAQLLREEYDRTREAVCTIVGCEELLDETPWLRRSILVRNGYVDPLNFVQIELMRRAAAATDLTEAQAEELSRLTQRAIKGVAAGMRTTG